MEWAIGVAKNPWTSFWWQGAQGCAENAGRADTMTKPVAAKSRPFLRLGRDLIKERYF